MYWRRQRLELPMLNQVQLLNSIPKAQIKHFCFAFANTFVVRCFFFVIKHFTHYIKINNKILIKLFGN